MTDLARGGSHRIAGLAVCVAGAALIATAFGLFRSTVQDPAPWQASPELIAQGIYRFTRNPMYVGMGLLQARALPGGCGV